MIMTHYVLVELYNIYEIVKEPAQSKYSKLNTNKQPNQKISRLNQSGCVDNNSMKWWVTQFTFRKA